MIFSLPAAGVARSWPLMALLLQFFITSAWAKSPDEWLLRMGQAFQQQNYDGTFIYMRGDELQSFRIIHRFGAGAEHERLIHLDGTARELIRNAEGVFVIQAESASTPADTTAPTTTFAQSFIREPQMLAQHYQLELLADERVTNRQSKRITIRPRDPDRYSYELWIDQDSGLLLRSLLKDLDGRILERFQFVTLKVADGIQLGDLTPMVNGPVITLTLQPEAAHMAWKHSPEWMVGWVPNGFVSQRHPNNPPDDDQSKLIHSELFSDGLYAFSVFIEKADKDDPLLDGVRQRGATSAVTNRIQHLDQDVMVTVVGEIPLETANRIAGSVAPSSP